MVPYGSFGPGVVVPSGSFRPGVVNPSGSFGPGVVVPSGSYGVETQSPTDVLPICIKLNIWHWKHNSLLNNMLPD